MKLHLLNRSSVNNSSLRIKYNAHLYFLKVWHYHPELELVYVLKSRGTNFIGDSIEKFEPGDVVLIGKNLPHMWLNDAEYFEKQSNLKAESISIHFEENFLGETFFQIPEMMSILKLIEKSKYGVKFTNVPKSLKQKIKKILNLEGFYKIVSLLDILNDLSILTEAKLLSNDGYVNSLKTSQTKNLDKVYEYIFDNFNKQVSLQKVAEIANMNSSSFSRYFKKINRKPFSRYLNEIRIGYACKLLLEGKYTIIQVCYESGFNNVSNFNRQFKLIKKIPPSVYLKLYEKDGFTS